MFHNTKKNGDFSPTRDPLPYARAARSLAPTTRRTRRGSCSRAPGRRPHGKPGRGGVWAVEHGDVLGKSWDFHGIFMVIFMGFSWDFMGFHGICDFMIINICGVRWCLGFRVSWWFDGVSWCFMEFHGISLGLMGYNGKWIVMGGMNLWQQANITCGNNLHKLGHRAPTASVMQIMTLTEWISSQNKAWTFSAAHPPQEAYFGVF